METTMTLSDCWLFKYMYSILIEEKLNKTNEINTNSFNVFFFHPQSSDFSV